MKHLKKVLLTTSLLTVCMTAGITQARVTFGPELQVYPTGALPGIFVLYHLDQRNAVSARFGYNIVRHGDAGVHDDERGGGFGGTLGFRRDFGTEAKGWFGELRSDLWFNEVDWQDTQGDVVIAEGTSDVTVLQPTAKLGYRLPLGNSKVHLMSSIAFGIEINVKTEGAAVGQGAILLVGVGLGFPL